MMSSGLYAQNGILTYVAMNFLLVSDAWSRVSGIIAVSFASFVFCTIVPYPTNDNVKIEENNVFKYSNTLVTETIEVRN